MSRGKFCPVAGLLCYAMLFSNGCQMAAPSRHAIHSRASSETFIVHLPGIAGETEFDHLWVSGLGSGGVADHLEVYDWTKPMIWIPALLAYSHNRAEARVISSRMAGKLKADPQARIILTAWSGGCQVAVWALEDLPPQAQVQSLLVVAPSITPTYDLSRALSHVRGNMYAMTSSGDWFVLGIGTSLFGTSDGTRCLAAGLVGFTRPKGADKAEYRKLHELRFTGDWLQYGDLGGHTGAMSRQFAASILAPLLVGDCELLMKSSTSSPVMARHSTTQPTSSTRAN